MQCCATEIEQRLILVIEIHGRAEMEFEHAERCALDEQRQRRRRCKSLVGGKRRRPPVLLLRVGERAGEDRLPALERVGRTETRLEFGRCRSPSSFSSPSLAPTTMRRLLDDGAGDGDHAGCFRQARGQARAAASSSLRARDTAFRSREAQPRSSAVRPARRPPALSGSLHRREPARPTRTTTCAAASARCASTTCGCIRDRRSRIRAARRNRSEETRSTCRSTAIGRTRHASWFLHGPAFDHASYSAGRLAADLMTTGARRRSDSLNGRSSPHSSISHDSR